MTALKNVPALLWIATAVTFLGGVAAFILDNGNVTDGTRILAWSSRLGFVLAFLCDMAAIVRIQENDARLAVVAAGLALTVAIPCILFTMGGDGEQQAKDLAFMSLGGTTFGAMVHWFFLWEGRKPRVQEAV